MLGVADVPAESGADLDSRIEAAIERRVAPYEAELGHRRAVTGDRDELAGSSPVDASPPWLRSSRIVTYITVPCCHHGDSRGSGRKSGYTFEYV